jgi:branched-chain amino acid transport system permease protein
MIRNVDTGRTSAVLLALAAVILPFVVSSFVLQNILAPAAWQGIVALSIVFLFKYAGMVSFGQVALYGVSSYTVAITSVTHGLPWYVCVVSALAASTLCAFIFGLLSARSYGIYFLMVTLLLGLVVYFLAASNQTITNGSTGIIGIYPPDLGSIRLTDPLPEYALNATVAALLLLGLWSLMRTQFGLALKGCRDNPRKMRAIGYTVAWYRVLAFTIAGFVAGVGGVLGAWHNGLVAPGNMNLTVIVGFLVMAVVGGVASMPGAFVGAAVYLLVTTYASSFTDRYNTLIGVIFLLVVMFMPNGIAGVSEQIRNRSSRAPRETPETRGRLEEGLQVDLTNAK